MSLESGQVLSHYRLTEKIGEGDDQTTTFYTSMPYKENQLWFFVDGVHVRTAEIDNEAGSFTGIDPWYASIKAPLIARYVYEGNLED